MEITVEYPLVMKMKITTVLEVTESTTLSDLIKMIADDFFQYYPNLVSQKKITLFFKEIEITTEKKLKEYLKPYALFQAVFY